MKIMKAPSLKQFVMVDQISFFLVVISCCFTLTIIFLFLKKYMAIENINFHELFADLMILLTTFMALPYVLLRYRKFHKLFTYGILLPAKIIKIDESLVPWFFIQYEFNYEQSQHRKLQIFMFSKTTKKIAFHKNIEILFNPKTKASYVLSVFED